MRNSRWVSKPGFQYSRLKPQQRGIDFAEALAKATEQAKKHTHPRVGVANIVIRNGEVLIGLRTGKHASGMYGFPGGHLELFESFEECAIRETKEEADITIPRDAPVVWTVENTMFKDEGKHFATIFCITMWEPTMGYPANMEPDKLQGWEWHNWFALPQPLMPGIIQLLSKGKCPLGTGYENYYRRQSVAT